MLSKREMKDAVRLMVNVMASGTHLHICSDLLFYCWHRSLLAPKKKIEIVKGNMRGWTKKMSEVFKVED